MNEIRRQAYLEAMGIDSWFPRYVLPGAAPSHPCAWPLPLPDETSSSPPAGAGVNGAAEPAPGVRASPAEIPGAEAPASRTAAAPASARVPGRPARPQLEDNPRPRRAPTRAGSPAGADGRRAVPRDTVHFRLAFLRCGPLVVLSHLPDLGAERLGGARHRLFLNLLRALGLPTEAARISADSFRWPFAEALLQDAGTDAARLALGAYLEEHIGDEPARVLLVLGEPLAPFVLPPDLVDAAEAGRLLRDEGLRWNVMFSRSLDEMLSVPTLKRDFWRDLAALRPLLTDA